jgi:GntR family transcriptional regulator
MAAWPPPADPRRRRRRVGHAAFSPLYQQIKGLILQSLEAGEWKPGEAIPSEMDLAARFRVSQGTVRKAIDELAAEQPVVRRQGKGTFVATHAEQHVRYRFLKLVPDSGDRDTEGPAQRTSSNASACAPAPTWRARWACAPATRWCRCAACCRSAACRPSSKTSGCPATPFKGLTAEQLAGYQGPTYAMFELEFGVRMVRAEEKIRAVAPMRSRRAAAVPPGAPLLSVERLAYTYNDVPMELRRGLYRTDTHHYRNELS